MSSQRWIRHAWCSARKTRKSRRTLRGVPGFRSAPTSVPGQTHERIKTNTSWKGRRGQNEVPRLEPRARQAAPTHAWPWLHSAGLQLQRPSRGTSSPAGAAANGTQRVLRAHETYIQESNSRRHMGQGNVPRRQQTRSAEWKTTVGQSKKTNQGKSTKLRKYYGNMEAEVNTIITEKDSGDCWRVAPSSSWEPPDSWALAGPSTGGCLWCATCGTQTIKARASAVKLSHRSGDGGSIA